MQSVRIKEIPLQHLNERLSYDNPYGTTQKALKALAFCVVYGMVRFILEMDGMTCGMRQSHVNDAIGKVFSVKSVRTEPYEITGSLCSA